MVSSALSNCCEESAQKKQNNHMQMMYNVLYLRPVLVGNG